MAKILTVRLNGSFQLSKVGSADHERIRKVGEDDEVDQRFGRCAVRVGELPTLG